MHFTSVLSIVAILGAAANAAPFPAPATEVKNSTSFLAPSPNASSSTMNTWTGTSCQGTIVYWSNPPAGYSCTNLQSVSSLDVTNLGGCSTYYYTANGCQGSPQHVDDANSCDGYAEGERILSFNVSC